MPEVGRRRALPRLRRGRPGAHAKGRIAIATDGWMRHAPGSATKGIVQIEPFMPATVKFFGRDNGVAIRDGVLLAIEVERSMAGRTAAWSCDSDQVW